MWSKLFGSQEAAQALRSLSRRQRRVGAAFLAVLVGSVAGILWDLNNRVSVEVPTSGGTLSEGIVGTPPLFINPLLAISDTDRDLSALVYSGLTRVGQDGKLIADLAESYSVSEDGLVYTFILKDGLKWHDGKALTTADVEFTVLKAQDPLIKSQKRASWEGVRVERVSSKEIRFHLRQPFAAFPEIAAMGILPEHIWKNFSPEMFVLNQFNIESVGSGPYRIAKRQKNESGITEYYDLEAFKHFALGRPKIDSLRVRFYPSEKEMIAAYRRGEVESMSAISAESAQTLAKQGARVISAPLPRVFGVFFNQNEAPVLAHKEVRQALDAALDRELIIDTVLKGYGRAARGPIPPSVLQSLNDAATSTAGSTASSSSKISEARQILEDNGWQWDEGNKAWEKKSKSGTETLAFSLATSDVPELREAAQLIKTMWEQAGAQVELKVYEIGDLNKDIIRPREYETLFFGQILGRTPDLFSFWHSSQRLDPGYNIALYTNLAVDKMLDDLRGAATPEATASLYSKIEQTIEKDIPAVFVYSPDFLYAVPKKVKNVSFPLINMTSDRFLNAHEWYESSDKVWKIFAK